MHRLTLLATVLILFSGCDKKDEAKEDTAAAPAEAPAGEETTAADKEAPPEQTKTAATEVTGDGFTAPIPAGYKLAAEEIEKQLGQQFGQQVDAVLMKDRTDGFRSSIVVTRVKSAGVDPADIEQCRKAASGMVGATGATLKQPAEVVEYPFGKTCQFAMGDDEQHAIQTVAYVGDKYWTVTCNMGTDDTEGGSAECKQLLEGFAE